MGVVELLNMVAFKLFSFIVFLNLFYLSGCSYTSSTLSLSTFSILIFILIYNFNIFHSHFYAYL